MLWPRTLLPTASQLPLKGHVSSDQMHALWGLQHVTGSDRRQLCSEANANNNGRDDHEHKSIVTGLAREIKRNRA